MAKKKVKTTGKRTKRVPKEDSASSKVAKSGIQAWIERMSKDKKWAGKVQVKRASDVTNPYLYRIESPLLSLNIALGGGLHCGGVTEVQGAESAGKTQFLFSTAGRLQKRYGENTRILIGVNEMIPDVGFARQSGFCLPYSTGDIHDFEEIRAERGLEPFTEEEVADLRKTIGEIVIVYGDTGESLLQSIIEALDESRNDPTGGFQMMIVESLGALLPAAVEEKDVGERTFGGSAPMMTQFQTKIYPRLIFDRPDGEKQKTAIVGISQARANTDAGMYGPKTKSSVGAFAWKHGQFLNLELKKGAKIKEDKKVVGHEVRWEIRKGKAGTHDGKSGAFNYYHFPQIAPVFWSAVVNSDELVGIDSISDAVRVGQDLGLIDTSGAWLTWTEGRKTLIRSQGEAQFASKLMDEPELLEKLREDCIRSSGIMVRY